MPPSLQRRLQENALLVPAFKMNTAQRFVLGKLREAVRRAQKLKLRYDDANAVITERIVWPLGLFYWGEVWTLGAWCELRRDYRSFRIDRVRQMHKLEARFDAQHGALLRAYVAAQRDRDRGFE